MQFAMLEIVDAAIMIGLLFKTSMSLRKAAAQSMRKHLWISTRIWSFPARKLHPTKTRQDATCKQFNPLRDPIVPSGALLTDWR